MVGLHSCDQNKVLTLMELTFWWAQSVGKMSWHQHSPQAGRPTPKQAEAGWGENSQLSQRVLQQTFFMFLLRALCVCFNFKKVVDSNHRMTDEEAQAQRGKIPREGYLVESKLVEKPGLSSRSDPRPEPAVSPAQLPRKERGAGGTEGGTEELSGTGRGGAGPWPRPESDSLAAGRKCTGWKAEGGALAEQKPEDATEQVVFFMALYQGNCPGLRASVALSGPLLRLTQSPLELLLLSHLEPP